MNTIPKETKEEWSRVFKKNKSLFLTKISRESWNKQFLGNFIHDQIELIVGVEDQILSDLIINRLEMADIEEFETPQIFFIEWKPFLNDSCKPKISVTLGLHES